MIETIEIQKLFQQMTKRPGHRKQHKGNGEHENVMAEDIVWFGLVP
jgi:hypothetical protein